MSVNTVVEQARLFHKQGYLYLKNVLTAVQVETLSRLADEMVTNDPEKKQNYNFFGCVRQWEELQALADEPTVLPVIVNILGYNVQLYMSHLSVHFPFPAGETLPEENRSRWHMDGPRPYPPRVDGVTPVQSLKACYILSDLSEPGRGNTKIVPSSHRMPDYGIDLNGTGPVENELEVCAEPGDVFLFAQNTWHSVSVNRSQFTRKLFFLGYNLTWMRRLDDYTADDLIGEASPMRRQLFGDLGDGRKAYYFAEGKGLPLEQLYYG